jgi:HlyD family secretion protein
VKRFLPVVVIAVVIVVVLSLAYLRRSGDNAGAVYELALAVRSSMWVKVSATGLVEPVVEVEVKSEASGVVVELPVEEGDRVSRGQMIASLDPAEILNELERERALMGVASQAVKVEEEELGRVEDLSRSGLVAKSELENSRLELERARSEEISRRIAVANWEEKLDDTVLRSPIDGIVLEKRVEVGQVISSGVTSVTGGTTIVVIADLKRVYVKADVDETDIGRVRKGLRVEVVPDAFPDLAFSGVVERISPRSSTVQNVTTFEVVTVVDNERDILKAGMNATVEIVIAGKDEALTVPRRAVRAASDVPLLASYAGIDVPPEPDDPLGRVVFVETSEGITVRSVEVGLFDWDQVEVAEGLEEGERVLVFMTSRALEQSRESM